MTIETLKRLFSNCTILEDALIVESNLAEIIEFVKTKYGFEVCNSITAEQKDENVELTYSLYSPEDEEECIIITHAKDQAESITRIFESAKNDEKEISKKYSIKFI